MPTYPYKCPKCSTEFEVSRPMARAGDPAQCPVDGTTADRVFQAPTFSSKSSTSEGLPSLPPNAGFSDASHGHMHGAGGHDHSH